MKKLLIIFFVVIFLVLILIGYFFIIDQNKKNLDLNENLDKEITKEEYIEEYIDFIRDKNGYPVSLQNLEESESKVFIEKLNEVRLTPKNMLKVGNEIYFVSHVNKIDKESDSEEDGHALFLYDVIMRKFGELYFYKIKEQNINTRPVLLAVDIVGNKLVVVLQDKDLQCSSLWLEQNNNFYTLNLLNNGKDGLERYNIPKWKIQEERVNYSCD